MARNSFSGSVSVTVPAGLVYVLRDVDAVNQSNAGSTFAILGAVGETIWFVNPIFNANDLVAQWRGRQVFNAGESFSFTAGTGAWAFTASGYSLTVP